MKRTWTRGEKWLWVTPLLFGLIAVCMAFVPQLARRPMGWPESLITTPDTAIRSMALSRNGELIAAAGSIHAKGGWQRGSGTVYLWNARTAKQFSTIAPVYTHDSTGFTNGFDIWGLKLSPDAKQIGFSRVGGNWALYDTATQRELWHFPSFVSDAEFSRDGRFIVLSGYTHIAIVRASDGWVRTQWKLSGSENYRKVTWSPDGTLVASIGSYEAGNPIELNRSDNGKLVRRIQSARTMSGERVASVAFSPDSKRLIIAASVSSYSSTENFNLFAPVRCYDVSAGRLLWEVKSLAFGGADASHSYFCDAIFSPDGQFVAAYQLMEGKVILLDSATGSIRTTLPLGRGASSHIGGPPGLAFSPDGKRLFARGKSAVLFWDL